MQDFKDGNVNKVRNGIIRHLRRPVTIHVIGLLWPGKAHQNCAGPTLGGQTRQAIGVGGTSPGAVTSSFCPRV